MVLSAREILAGTMSVGDLVMVQVSYPDESYDFLDCPSGLYSILIINYQFFSDIFIFQLHSCLSFFYFFGWHNSENLKKIFYYLFWQNDAIQLANHGQDDAINGKWRSFDTGVSLKPTSSLIPPSSLSYTPGPVICDASHQQHVTVSTLS